MIHALNICGNSKDSPKSDDGGPALDVMLLSVLPASSFACVVLDRSGNIQSWNAGAEALLGWKLEEVFHKPFSELASDVAAENKVRSLIERPAATPSDLCLRKKNKEVLNVQISSLKLPASASIKAGCIFLLHDVTEKKFLEEALLEASDREQRRIGQELHDHLCQHLVGAAFAAKALAGTLDRDQSSRAPQLHDLARLINDAVSQVRDISRGLHPVELDEAGLMSSLQELANRARHTTTCIFQCKRHVLVKNTTLALNAYRIAQESVAAALQNPGAKTINIILSQSGSSIFLEISDDGEEEGELTANPAGIAAKTLHYRAKAMQGSLTLKFVPNQGTRVTCLFPS